MVAGFVDGDLEAEFKEFSSVVEAGDPLRLSEACARRELPPRGGRGEPTAPKDARERKKGL